MIEVELLGVARFLARREIVEVEASGPVTTAELLARLAEALPALVGTVLKDDGGLLGGHVLCRGGSEFLRDPEALIGPGERVMLLSLSAGGLA